jgi:hypothetical protein
MEAHRSWRFVKLASITETSAILEKAKYIVSLDFPLTMELIYLIVSLAVFICSILKL